MSKKNSGVNKDFAGFTGRPDLLSTDITAIVVKHVAYVLACSEAEVQAQLKVGDLKISHKEAMSVCTRVEASLNCGPFLHPADFSANPDCKRERKPDKCLSPAEDCTFAKVIDIIEGKLALALAFSNAAAKAPVEVAKKGDSLPAAAK